MAILPTTSLALYGEGVESFQPAQVTDFLENEIVGPVRLARLVERSLRSMEEKWARSSVPSILFVASAMVGDNPLRHVRAAAIHALIRVWRHEGQMLLDQLKGVPWQIYQLLLPANTNGAADDNCVSEWAAWLLSGLASYDEIDLQIKLSFWPSINNMMFRDNLKVQNICGLHSQRVALITGGSEGIGGEISRHLLASGARIAIAERHNEKLQRILQTLREDCRSFGYNDPDSRVMIIAGVDVSDGARLKQVVSQTVDRFGGIDFVINNAGLSGAEQMAVDMPRSLWERSMNGNFISNYRLMLDALPWMKRQGAGQILNITSYFAACRHGWIPYTNRSDYAVSKYGQIALAEAFAAFIGPDVQINALAPGPVDGKRLNGVTGQPGLYERRAKLVQENKLLNALHSTCVEAEGSGLGLELLALIAENDRSHLMAWLEKHSLAGAKGVREYFAAREKRGFRVGRNYLDRNLFEKLCARLNCTQTEISMAQLEPQQELFSKEEIQDGADFFRNGVLKNFAMEKMPTDADLAIAVAWNLAQRMITGEVLYPTNGFKHEGLQLTDNFRGDGMNLLAPEEFANCEIGHLLVVGNTQFAKMARVISSLAKSVNGMRRAEKVVVVLGSESGRVELQRFLRGDGLTNMDIVVDESNDPAKAFNLGVQKLGDPNAVISFPWTELRADLDEKIEPWQSLPSVETFTRFVEGNLTAHFLVAQKASVWNQCKVVLVTADSSQANNPLERSLADLFAKTLRPFTITAGFEGKHLPHRPVFHQVNGAMEGEAMARLIASDCGVNSAMKLTRTA